MSTANLNEIFFPHHNRQLNSVEDKGINFAHYTNADTAYKIIKTKKYGYEKLLS